MVFFSGLNRKMYLILQIGHLFTPSLSSVDYLMDSEYQTSS
jgi:hypothetical protein